MRVLVICLFLFTSGIIIAQNPVNQTDSQGRKQGFWTKKDTDGHLLYQATFKDDKPFGEMKRFHPNGKVKAILNYSDGSDKSDAQLFDERGKLIASGLYEGQKKTGVWNYFQESKIVAVETYLKGKKNGTCRRYYKTGELLEESNWLNDQLHGVYRAFFKEGLPSFECNYSEGKRNGLFKTWYANGTPQLDAFYTSDVRDRDWKYFEETGELLYTLKFDLGKLLNPEVQDSIDRKNTELIQKNNDRATDPEKFMQNPEEYMRLMKIR